MPTLRQLTHLTVLVEEGTYTRAAQRVHLTQPALTRSIQSLEKTLGVRLLDRRAGRVYPTQSGRSLCKRIARILTEVDTLKRDAAALRSHDAGSVRFGAGVFPAAVFLAPLLKQLAAEFPRIAVHVEVESWQRLLEKLDAEKLDFVVAITHSLPPPRNCVTRPLSKQLAGLFVRAGHPLLQASRSGLEKELMKYGLAATDLPPRARQHLAYAYGLAEDETLPITLECDDVDALRNVTLSSDTVLFSTRDAIGSDVMARRLVQLPIQYFADTELTCSVIHQAGLTLTPAAETVIALIQKIMPSNDGQAGDLSSASVAANTAID